MKEFKTTIYSDTIEGKLGLGVDYYKGETGKSGADEVYIGAEPPTDPQVKLWVDTEAQSVGAVDWNDVENKPNFATVAESGSYNDLIDKPVIPEAPDLTAYATESWVEGKGYTTMTEVEAKGYLTEHQDLSTYALKSEIPSLTGYAKTADLSTVATSGSYEDLTNKPNLFSGDYQDLTNKPTIPDAYTLPTASTDTLGGVKVDGSTITIADGVISSVGGGSSGNNDFYRKDPEITEYQLENVNYDSSNQRIQFSKISTNDINKNAWQAIKNNLSNNNIPLGLKEIWMYITVNDKEYLIDGNTACWGNSSTVSWDIIPPVNNNNRDARVAIIWRDLNQYMDSDNYLLDIQIGTSFTISSVSNIKIVIKSYERKDSYNKCFNYPTVDGYYGKDNNTSQFAINQDESAIYSLSNDYRKRFENCLVLGKYNVFYGKFGQSIILGTRHEYDESIYNSITIGTNNSITNSNKYVFGRYLMSEYNDPNESLILGKYNISGKYTLLLGNGTSDSNRANALTVDTTGNLAIAGTMSSAGADYAEFFEWKDGNPEAEDRVGYIVSLDGDKIILANEGDYILGVVSGTATVLGDNPEWNWAKRWITDDFGRIQYEDVVIHHEAEEINGETIPAWDETIKAPIVNPDYNPDQKYIKRADRPEWSAVGMMGKLYVRDDGTCQVNGYAKPINGVATASTSGTMRVIERVSDNVIRVVIK